MIMTKIRQILHDLPHCSNDSVRVLLQYGNPELVKLDSGKIVLHVEPFGDEQYIDYKVAEGQINTNGIRPYHPTSESVETPEQAAKLVFHVASSHTSAPIGLTEPEYRSRCKDAKIYIGHTKGVQLAQSVNLQNLVDEGFLSRETTPGGKVVFLPTEQLFDPKSYGNLIAGPAFPSEEQEKWKK